MEYTKELETPVGKHKVVIKTMITGAERESIENAAMKYMKTTDGRTFQVTDMDKVGLANKHRHLEISVESIDGDSTDKLKRLQKMYEPDYEFVYNEILDAQKKMKKETSPASS